MAPSHAALFMDSKIRPVTDESNGCFSSVNSVKSKAENTTNSFITDTVTVYIPTLAQTVTEFCYVAIGTMTRLNVAVAGTFMTGTWNSREHQLSSVYSYLHW